MAKEPTKPPEGSKKPNPSDWIQAEIDGELGRIRQLCLDGPEGVYTDRTSEVAPPNTPLARAMFESGRTSDPGYEPPSRTDQESPDCVPVTPTFEPPGERVGEAGGSFWDSIPPADEPEDDVTEVHSYGIIEDMGGLFASLVEGAVGATAGARAAALRWLARGIACVFGTVILVLLLIGALGVVCTVWLITLLGWTELRLLNLPPKRGVKRTGGPGRG
jgi:hypothetical protein